MFICLSAVTVEYQTLGTPLQPVDSHMAVHLCMARRQCQETAHRHSLCQQKTKKHENLVHIFLVF